MTSLKYRAFDVPAYYHVYNRGAGKRKIFLDAADKRKFLALLARYLDPELDEVRGDGVTYTKSPVCLIAYCLMGNHFHLMLYQEDNVEDVRQLVNSVSIAYSMYFNKRYKQSGRLFEGPFRATPITGEAQFAHITRYIHLNPRSYKTYRWSSLSEFTGKRSTPWVHPERVMSMPPKEYMDFLAEYEDRRHELKLIAKSLNIL
ncbi:MAG: transposase [Candidatus Saccharimonadales bacterium]